jgi:Family of unknown function (DUF5681)
MQPVDKNSKENVENSVPEQGRDLTPASEGVGFCRPPHATRFKKGFSGNPNGRPKGSLNVATAFMKALREKVVINEGGKRKTVTKLEAALKQLVNKAASGDISALKQLVELSRDAEAKQNAASASRTRAFCDIDLEVMEGILERFKASDDQSMEASDVSQSA